ncbi:hypothetical protein PpBr36_07555 [Pyricularia pennisetigena]|uniref:hypothetical protein n=1 Tax=Pyricularia pennisetigena TaxID=1578925 RepID=UPI001151D37D|nr:hypothetical protein PpBr36_07555 [Pyricularia pennisetigena]TLS24969.1 hypothetical protein PpBr36_07555 [Pyricularia pennisetigena]
MVVVRASLSAAPAGSCSAVLAVSMMPPLPVHDVGLVLLWRPAVAPLDDAQPEEPGGGYLKSGHLGVSGSLAEEGFVVSSDGKGSSDVGTVWT